MALTGRQCRDVRPSELRWGQSLELRQSDLDKLTLSIPPLSSLSPSSRFPPGPTVVDAKSEVVFFALASPLFLLRRRGMVG